jgi:hypothetical protein
LNVGQKPELGSVEVRLQLHRFFLRAKVISADLTIFAAKSIVNSCVNRLTEGRQTQTAGVFFRKLVFLTDNELELSNKVYFSDEELEKFSQGGLHM